jgi:hypothetical protein
MKGLDASGWCRCLSYTLGHETDAKHWSKMSYCYLEDYVHGPTYIYVQIRPRRQERQTALFAIV